MIEPTPSDPADPAEPGLVDAHTHILPLGLARRIRSFFDAHLPGVMVMDVDPDVVAARLRAEGVQIAWTLPYAHKPGMSERLNADIATLARRISDERLHVVNGCTVHPADEHPAAVLRRAAEQHGARVLKLHCSVGDYDVDDPRLDDVYQEAGDAQMPVVLHVGRAVTGRTADDDLAALGDVASRHPRTPIIIAHAAHPATSTALELLERHDNLYADLTPVVIETVDVDGAVLERFADRLLLGSDAPNTAVSYDRLLGWLAASGASEAAQQQIRVGTAMHLVPLPG